MEEAERFGRATSYDAIFILDNKSPRNNVVITVFDSSHSSTKDEAQQWEGVSKFDHGGRAVRRGTVCQGKRIRMAGSKLSSCKWEGKNRASLQVEVERQRGRKAGAARGLWASEGRRELEGTRQ